MLKSLILILAGLLLALLLRWAWTQMFSFHAQKPTDYAGTTPAFDITRVLNGAMDTEGMIYDFRGRVTARFTARMHATWTGDTGMMTEDFTYSTGNLQHREWQLKMGENGHFTATAPDIVGTAHGQQVGATARLKYRIVLTAEAGGHALDVVDWMYLMDNGVVMNRSEFRKFGIKVAELVATFRPAS